MLKALILPLIIPSLIAAIGQLDMSLSGKVGGRAVAYYMITTVLAVILGIILVTTIRPGASAKIDKDAKGVRIELHGIIVNYFILFNYLIVLSIM